MGHATRHPPRRTTLASSPPTEVKDDRACLSPSGPSGTGGNNMTMRSSVTVRSGLIAIGTLVAVVAGCGRGAPELEVSSRAEKEGQTESDHHPPFNFQIRTLSNRADLISDGDALVEVRVPKNVPMHKVTLTLNGASVDSAFVADAEARTLRCVLGGLAAGQNRFVAQANGG